MSGLIFRVTHKRTDNPDDPCPHCGAVGIELDNYVCSGAPPEDGTFTKAILDEVKELRQLNTFCECGASSIRGCGHAYWCPLSWRN